MKTKLALILAGSLCASCLMKYSFQQTGEPGAPLSPLYDVRVFMENEPPFATRPVGILAFTDPLPLAIQIKEAQRIARENGGNVIIRVKNDSAERAGGYTFRIVRADESLLGNAGRYPYGEGGERGADAASYSGAGMDGFLPGGGTGAGPGEPPPFTYIPE